MNIIMSQRAGVCLTVAILAALAGGSRKTVFGKEFEYVCRTTMRFDNPDAETVECMKRLIELRKNNILKNTAKGL